VNYQPPSWLFWVLLGTAISLAVWRTIADTKKSIHNEEQLDSVKTSLVTIGQYEREAAIKQSKSTHSKNVKTHILDDFVAFYPTSKVGLVLREALENNNIDPLINFYSKFGDVLDANGCGLKDQLQSIPQYNNAIANLTSKSVTLRLSRKKVDLIHANVSRLLKGGYGLNSGIVLRSMMKTIRPRSTNEEAALHTVIVGLEEIENIGREFVTYGLDHLDKKWKPGKAMLADFHKSSNQALRGQKNGIGEGVGT